MKKTYILIAMILASYLQVLAAGSASISPDKIAVSAQVSAFTITFTPQAGTSWTAGKVSFEVPEMFNPEPLTITPYSGQISAILHSSSTGNTAVPASSIQTDGRAVTINALSFQPNDYLVITYGLYDGYQAFGVNGPFTAGNYIFTFKEAPSGTGFSVVGEQPVVSVNNLRLTKSTSASIAAAGNTVTYTIGYRNLSSVHQIDSVSIWDTVPQGLTIIGTNLPAAVNTGSYISWNIGSMLYSMDASLQVYCMVQTGIANRGASITNTVNGYGKDMYNNNFYSSASVSLATSGPILHAFITSSPSAVITGQHITVVMTVSNSGNGPATNISPDNFAGNSGTALAQLVTGPVPAIVSTLAKNASVSFTWIYNPLSAGVFSFTGAARAKENNLSIETLPASSNQVYVSAPTPTATADPTPVNTDTPVVIPTDTPVVIPTDTPVVIPTDIPTDTPVTIPTRVKGGNVYTDRNYIRQGTGERFLIYYEVPGAGILEVTVFNLSGETIRHFTKEYDAVKTDYIYWDGKNDAQQPVGKGIYFVLVKMDNWSKMKKVVILK